MKDETDNARLAERTLSLAIAVMTFLRMLFELLHPTTLARCKKQRAKAKQKQRAKRNAKGVNEARLSPLTWLRSTVPPKRALLISLLTSFASKVQYQLSKQLENLRSNLTFHQRRRNATYLSIQPDAPDSLSMMGECRYDDAHKTE